MRTRFTKLVLSTSNTVFAALHKIIAPPPQLVRRSPSTCTSSLTMHKCSSFDVALLAHFRQGGRVFLAAQAERRVYSLPRQSIPHNHRLHIRHALVVS